MTSPVNFKILNTYFNPGESVGLQSYCTGGRSLVKPYRLLLLPPTDLFRKQMFKIKKKITLAQTNTSQLLGFAAPVEIENLIKVFRRANEWDHSMLHSVKSTVISF